MDQRAGLQMLDNFKKSVGQQFIIMVGEGNELTASSFDADVGGRGHANVFAEYST